MKYTLAVLFFAVYAFTGCGPKPKSDDKAPSPNIKDSFAVAETEKLVGVSADKSRVVIKKAAFEKEFLLSSGIIKQLPGPHFEGLESMIVSFIQRDGKLYMLNVTGTQQVGSKQGKEPLPLAEFKILLEEKEFVEIDFNSGMSLLFKGANELAVDDIDQDYGLKGWSVRISYLEQVKFENESLLIRQKAVVRHEDTDIPLEIRYQLKPYLPDPSFRQVLNIEDKRMAFFTTAPIFGEDGWDEKYVSKYNEKKKIQFAISANTPEEMRPVIRDGLLYWNRVLGEGKIEVVQLEDQSVKAPHFDMNIVQWVDWETLGTAYASWHSDPRTGEVLSGNIFLPSGKYAVPLMMAKGELYLQVGLKGFAKTELCREGIRHQPESTGPVLSDEVGSHMAKNSLFVTVAHEAGHLLGLRHNFAGSLSSSFDYKDRQSILDKYYRTLSVPDDLSVASTVMDYLPTEEKSLLGDIMRKKSGEALAYDKMALEILYHEAPLTDENRTAFCTDDDVGNYADCQRFDSGRSVVSYAAGSFQAELKALPLKLMKRYIPSPKSKSANLDRANFNVSGHAGTMVEYISELVSLFKSPRLIAIESKYLSITNSNRDAIRDETQKYIASEFVRLGGASMLIDAVPENFKQNVTAGFQALTVQNPKFKENFASSEQQQQIQSQLQITLNQYEEALAQGEIKALASADSKQPWADSVLSRELVSIISARFAKYALAKTGTTTQAEVIYTDGTKKEALLPNYVFSDSVRTAAAGIFSGEAEAVEWAVSEKAAAKKAIENELEILGDLGKIDPTKLSPHPLRWMMNNQNLLKKIN